jgi:cytolysin-activating lysine-acyltransferase
MSGSNSVARAAPTWAQGAEPLGEAALVDALTKLAGEHDHGAAAAAQPGAPGAKTVAAVLGEIVWLMTQSPRHQPMPLADLEWLVMPPVLLKQFRIYYSGERPVGVVLWALVNAPVQQRLRAGEKRLSAAEWKCGSQREIVDVIAPFGGEEEMRREIEQMVPAG